MKKVVSIGLMVVSLYADFTMIYKMDGKINEVVEYKDDKNVKLSYIIDGDENSSAQTGQYLIDGKRYSVVREEDGRLTYMDMDMIDEKSSEITDELNISKESCVVETKPFFTILKKGDTKTIRGVKGEVWDVESQEDGEKYREKIVVSDNRELVDAMRRSFKVLKMFGEGPYGMEIGDDVESMMLVTKDHVLLSAAGIEFVSLDHKDIPSGTIVLPKDAVNGMQNLPQMSDEEKELGKEVLKNVLESDNKCIAKLGDDG
jgi:hypothetical protein